MIPINQFIDIVKKHGALGVLALWLAYTHFEVQDVKDRLYNCLEARESINRKPIEERQPAPIIKSDTVAVIDNKNRKLAKK